MVEALIIAGGIGERTDTKVPKQFFDVLGKPIIIYTLEAFENHGGVDAITVVCLDGWQDILRQYCLQFNIAKLVSIVSGGKSGQQSIYNGIKDIAKRRSGEDVVIIHEANRPLVSADVITDSICVCKKFGGAVAATECTDAILRTNSDGRVGEYIPRETLVKAQNPHTFTLQKLLWAHEEAAKREIEKSVATSTLMLELGERFELSLGSEKNFKITTNEDIEIFTAMVSAQYAKQG